MDSFGAAPFGVARWSHRILWENIPEYDKVLDARDANNSLYKFTQTMGDMLNQPRREIRKFLSLRDASSLRTKWDETVSITPTAILYVGQEDSSDGRAYIEMTLSDGASIKAVGPEWYLDDDLLVYPIRSIDKVGNTLQVYTSGSAVPLATTFTARPTSLLQHLGSDFDVFVDGAEPEVNQRSSVYDNHKLLDLKGTEKGITVRASMGGFEAVVYSLYRIATDASSTLGADHVWQIPDASGQWYTDIAPTVPLYDAIPADMIATDAIGNCSVIESAGTVTSSTGTAGEWVTTLSTSVAFAVSGYWYFTYDSDTSADPTRYYVDPSIAVGAGEVGIGSVTQPIAGAVTWKFYCPIETNCDWCKSYKLRIELNIISAELLASPRALESAFQRMKKKIESMLPAHVKVVQYVFSTTHTAAIVRMLSASVSQTLQFNLFDQDAADVHPTDQFTITTH